MLFAKALYHIGSAIGTAIINHDDFRIREMKAQVVSDSFQSGTNPRCFVVSRDDNRKLNSFRCCGQSCDLSNRQWKPVRRKKGLNQGYRLRRQNLHHFQRCRYQDRIPFTQLELFPIPGRT